MRRLIIICEGKTEQEFCRRMLYFHFLEKGIQIYFPLIKLSKGGIVAWVELKKQILGHLKKEKEVIVTTFIDFYGIKKTHRFPFWVESISISNKAERIDFLERKMKLEIPKNLERRFIPNIQLHEFETLLFSDIEVFKTNFAPNEMNDFAALEKVFADFPNPEDINDGPKTAPSKRLAQIIKGYNKYVYGSCLAESLTLPKIRAKCPRFNTWIEKLETI